MSLIEVKKLTKTYYDGEVPTNVLCGVDFKIDKGEFMAIMGPSGSGKSTILHILGFLDTQTSGNLIFDGKDSLSYNKNEVAKIRNKKLGFVFQSFNLLPRTTVFDNVKLPLIYSKVDERKWDDLVSKAIDSVGLSHRKFYETSDLSGGEKQRVAIARALVNNPEVIFADEPTGNLDSKSGKVIMEILQKLNKENGHTIILITHETQTAEYAERIIHIKDGQIEKEEKVAYRRDATKGFSK
ncbi:ABC transporter ATP-binding protein [Candidatus Nomurabacteria bacterium]|nr:ABC transporter ATP-binding protein [Candidatus Nomurabacteria bacterium]